MSAAQPEPRSRRGCPGTPGFTTVSTSGDGPGPHLPRTRAAAVAIPGRTVENSPADTSDRLAVEGVAAVSATAARADMILPPLTGDLYDWMALRRVSGGGIAKMGDHWLEHGHRIPGYVADALAVLCDTGVMTLAELDVWGTRRAVLTDTGTVRYQQLCRRQQTTRRLPAAESSKGATWLADHPHARNVVQSVWDRLAELEQAGHPGAVAALRRILADHRPTPAGRCRACRRFRWRRRRFPCIVWHQIHTELR